LKIAIKHSQTEMGLVFIVDYECYFFSLSPPFFHYIKTWLLSHRCASDTQIRTAS